MKNIKGLSLIGIVLMVLLVSACGKQASKTDETKLKVVTSFYPMYEFTRQVVGERGDVSVLVNGEEPHDFEPSAKDIAMIADADVFVYNGEDMETWVPSVLKSIDLKKTTVIKASQGIDLLAGEDHHEHEESLHHDGLHLHGVADHYHEGDQVTIEAHGPENDEVESYRWSRKTAKDDAFSVVEETKETHEFVIKESTEIAVARLSKEGKVIDEMAPVTLTVEDHQEDGHVHEHTEKGHHHEFDPHVWLDPLLAKQEVATIAEALVKIDPANKNDYQANAKVYTKRLEDLDQQFKTAFEKASNKVFVTQHTAFAYLANRYDLQQLGISGLSPDLEPTPKELMAIEDFVKEHQVKVIFTEELASPKIAQTVAEATGASLEVLNPLENLSPDNLKEGLDYIGVMEKNLQALKQVIK